MTQPSRLTFWRMILGIVPPAALLTLWQLWNLAAKLNIAPQASKSWLAALGVLALVAVLSLGLLALTWSARRERLLDGLEASAKITGPLRWTALPALLMALTGSSFIIFHTYYGDLLRNQDYARFFIFLLLALLGMNALKMLWPAISWPAAFLVTILLQTATYRVLLYLPDITDYPFALGWSEVTRYYLPSLFLSKSIYGQNLPWPVINPSLHILLLPPYLVDAPLWMHRAWQVLLRVGLVTLLAPALISRLKIRSKFTGWIFGLWIFLYFFQGPLYFHLALVAMMILYGFSASNQRQTWLVVILASIWSGLSRINWFPVAGTLAAVLYFLEVPYQGQKFWRYLMKPAVWFVVGFAVAFLSQRLYIAISGVQDTGLFFTSVSSVLLLYRLWPNASFKLGVLPGILLATCALWLVIYLVLRRSRSEFHPLRLLLIGGAILMFLGGGLIVSMKIGGGADLHNMDAYLLLLLVVASFLIFGRHTPENNQPAKQAAIPWQAVALLVVIPVWFALRGASTLMEYDPAQSQVTLSALQQRVDTVNAAGGKILFITQRHLVPLKMLKGVNLVREYEREELMEMAISNYQPYLEGFYSDLKSQRFAVIVVDVLQINYLGSNYSLGEENDAWVRRVAKPILCNYRLDVVFPADHIAIYVPQEGAAHCP